MLKVIVFGLLSYFHSSAAFAGGCGGTSPFPEIIPCPPMPYVSTWPKCDKTIPIHRIHGDLYYWHDFLTPADQPCEIEIEHFAANIVAKENLNTCEVFNCDPVSNPDCVHEILLYPYFANTITTTKVIAGQRECSRRKYVAEGCFVEGTNGRIFVANWIDFDLNRTPAPVGSGETP